MFGTSILRVAASTRPAPGGARGTLTRHLRKLFIGYCEKSASSRGLREYLVKNAADLARANPSVEFVLVQRPQRTPLLRGYYRASVADPTVNGQQKEINVHNYQASQVGPRIQQLLETSGAKTKGLKRTPVKSVTESARGIWSQFHDEARQL
ncbi:39S ribosomal protein L51, mitochondrial [Malassezia cuniculi]|uniref:Large ribosomal subunit protein mL43 n=1 Tax=Malassezia cuniculi TaxID=948313 RepID=A0AAF0ESE8_9BASI|nr:39S ribosomal protein L51, mitochondrial [Malassezia cuniculi]